MLDFKRLNSLIRRIKESMESIAEIWKDVQGYEGLYQVSNLGRVKSLIRGYYWQKERILKPRKNHDGYLRFTLCKDGKTKTFYIHRLVAVAFIPNPENKPQIDHINAIKTDNTVNNLRWVTAKENVRNPLNMVHLIGKNHPMFGKKHSEETKNKMRGKNNPTARKVKNIETKEIFDTVTDAEKKYNLSRGCIKCAIKRNHKSAGYHWEYV